MFRSQPTDHEETALSDRLAFLRLVDVRLLLGFSLLGMVALFSARSLFGLLIPGSIIAVLLVRGGQVAHLLRLVRQMRWLLLSMLLLHLLFTPGRTLFGSLLLSLDGLQRGLLVGAQLVLAAALSLVIAASTSPVSLVAALQSLLSPWGLWRAPVHRFAEQLLLTLQLVPLLREEWTALRPRWRGRNRRSWRRLQGAAGVLIAGLVARVDGLAQRSAAGEEPFPALRPLPGFDARSAANGWALLVLLTAAGLVWWS